MEEERREAELHVERSNLLGSKQSITLEQYEGRVGDMGREQADCSVCMAVNNLKSVGHAEGK